MAWVHPAPAQHRGLAMRSLPLWLPLAFVLLAAATPLLSDYALEIGFRILLLVTLAEAWNLLAGYGGLVSLGTACFFGIGAYACTGLLNKTGTPLALALPAAGLCAAVVAAAVSRAVFRMRGLYFTVGTLALAEAMRMFMVNYNGFGGASGLFLTQDPPSAAHLYLIALTLFGVTTAFMTGLTRSRFGILLRAVRDDEDAAAQIGVRPFRIKLVAFVVASVLMGMAGGLQAVKLGAIEPYGMFGLQWTVNVLSIVIIGGQGLRAGPVVGAVFVVALGEALADYPAVHLALTGVILIAVIRYAPRGLVGLALGAWRGRRP